MTTGVRAKLHILNINLQPTVDVDVEPSRRISLIVSPHTLHGHRAELSKGHFSWTRPDLAKR